MVKKAQGHVEIILSMVLFIGFLIFIFVFFNPIIKTKKDSIDSIQKKIMDEITSNIGKLSVVVEKPDEDCYSLDEVKDEYLKKVNGEYVNNFIETRETSDEKIYTIYFGDFFDPVFAGKISCDDKKERNFKLGGYIEDKIIVYEKIIDLKRGYENGLLQKSFGTEEFLFSVKGIDGNIIEEASVNKKIPKNVDIISKDIPIRAMKKNGLIYELTLNIKNWD